MYVQDSIVSENTFTDTDAFLIRKCVDRRVSMEVIDGTLIVE